MRTKINKLLIKKTLFILMKLRILEVLLIRTNFIWSKKSSQKPHSLRKNNMHLMNPEFILRLLTRLVRLILLLRIFLILINKVDFKRFIISPAIVFLSGTKNILFYSKISYYESGPSFLPRCLILKKSMIVMFLGGLGKDEKVH